MHCTWCGSLLPTPPKRGSPPEAPEGLGICRQCADTLRADLDVSLDRFRSESGPAVVVVTRDVRVVDASLGAVDMLEDATADGAPLVGRPGGEVFGCENAELPGGCGATPNCSDCTVRRVVTSTRESGQPQVRVPATLRVTSHSPKKRISFLITTAKVGDNVLLRIDSPGL